MLTRPHRFTRATRPPIYSLVAARLGTLFHQPVPLLFLLVLLASGAMAPAHAQTTPAGLRVAIIKTGDVQSREGLVFAAGSLTRSVLVNHVAVLLAHGTQRVLVDTGLGERIDQQFLDEMPWWGKPLFQYRKGVSALRQLQEAGEPAVQRIVLTHGHWDHASGLVDFPDASVWTSSAEQAYLAQPHPAAVLPSQLAIAPQRWRTVAFDGKGHAGFTASHDLFGDGSALLLPQPGHTPGSLALLVSTGAGRKLLFVGDTVWRAAAVAAQSPKFWLAEKVVDNDPDQTLQQVHALHQFAQDHPDTTIVPAHDASVHDRLGYFPQWIP